MSQPIHVPKWYAFKLMGHFINSVKQIHVHTCDAFMVTVSQPTHADQCDAFNLTGRFVNCVKPIDVFLY